MFRDIYCNGISQGVSIAAVMIIICIHYHFMAPIVHFYTFVYTLTTINQQCLKHSSLITFSYFECCSVAQPFGLVSKVYK